MKMIIIGVIVSSFIFSWFTEVTGIFTTAATI